MFVGSFEKTMGGFLVKNDFALEHSGMIGAVEYTWMHRGGGKCDDAASPLPRSGVRGAIVEMEAIRLKR